MCDAAGYDAERISCKSFPCFLCLSCEACLILITMPCEPGSVATLEKKGTRRKEVAHNF
jgi:hypothetical protein